MRAQLVTHPRLHIAKLLVVASRLTSPRPLHRPSCNNPLTCPPSSPCTSPAPSCGPAHTQTCPHSLWRGRQQAQRARQRSAAHTNARLLLPSVRCGLEVLRAAGSLVLLPRLRLQAAAPAPASRQLLCEQLLQLLPARTSRSSGTHLSGTGLQNNSSGGSGGEHVQQGRVRVLIGCWLGSLCTRRALLLLCSQPCRRRCCCCCSPIVGNAGLKGKGTVMSV